MPHTPAAIALGSNLGDRQDNLRRAAAALESLPGISSLRLSTPITTDPVAPPGAHGPLGGPYLNAAATFLTSIPPRDLLDALLAIERTLGRTRDPEHRFAPRTIDLDLLLHGSTITDEPGLVLPHPRLHLRRFVLAPLAQIAPDWIVPSIGRTVAALLADLPADLPAPTASPS